MSNIKLPDYIKVGPYLFEINERSEAWHRQTGDYGSCILDDLQINVVTEGRPQMFVMDTLVHELLHGVWAVTHLSDDDKEERVVASIATGWLAVLRDNPELCTFINTVINMEKTQ